MRAAMRECDCTLRNVTVTPFRCPSLVVQVDHVCPECRGIFSEEIRDKAAMACIEYIQARPDIDVLEVVYA